jgi:hypothetical protein
MTARNKLSFEILDAILDAADLYLSQPGKDDGYEDADQVTLRPAYRGRGYRPEGFGLVVSRETVLYAFLAGAGAVEGERQAEGVPGFDVVGFARSTELDQMGKDHIIAWWPDWEVTDLPGVYTKD